MWWIYVVVISMTVLGMLLFGGHPPSARYPDGKCYQCRRGTSHPGDTCPKCGTPQPPVTTSDQQPSVVLSPLAEDMLSIFAAQSDPGKYAETEEQQAKLFECAKRLDASSKEEQGAAHEELLVKGMIAPNAVH